MGGWPGRAFLREWHGHQDQRITRWKVTWPLKASVFFSVKWDDSSTCVLGYLWDWNAMRQGKMDSTGLVRSEHPTCHSHGGIPFTWSHHRLEATIFDLGNAAQGAKNCKPTSWNALMVKCTEEEGPHCAVWVHLCVCACVKEEGQRERKRTAWRRWCLDQVLNG